MNLTHNNRARLAALAALCMALPAGAQLHEQINVDGRYVPDVIRIDRINAFPKALKSTLSSSPLSYESRGVAASFNPSLVTLPATGWRSTRDISSNRGYLELGAGSWLNSTLSAGYRFIDNPSTLFGIRLQHNSTSLWKPQMSELTSDVKQFRYDESLGLFASHVVDGYGRLDLALDYHLGYFNYYGVMDQRSTTQFDYTPFKTPTQTINDVAFRADWKSVASSDNGMTWHASARARHFAYRALYHGVYTDSSTDPHIKGARETNVGLEGGIRLPWDNGSSIGIDGNIDMIFLSNTSLDNYGIVTLTPYYRFSKGLLDIRLGADVDLSVNAGEKGERYSLLHVAPDVRFGLQTGQVGLYLDVLGGTEPLTLARLHQLDYYNMPTLVTTRPTYSPLDAAFGINLGPFSGFSLGAKVRYKVAQNIPLGGWYTAYLNMGDGTIPGLHATVGGRPSTAYGTTPEGINLHGYSLSGQIGYDYGDVFSISAEGSYQPQDGKKGFFNGYDRPKITGSAKLAVRPVKPFKIGVGLEYRGKRDIYTTYSSIIGDTPWFSPATRTTIIDGKTTEYCRLRLSDITLLNAFASWDVSKTFSVWLQANNLLNRNEDILPMQLSQGVVVVGGFEVQF